MTLTKKQLNTVGRCELFADLSEEEVSFALEFFSATARAHRKGECIYEEGEALPCFGLVLSGTVQALTDDINGERVIMANVTEGETFGESLCFLARADSPVSIHAAENSEVLWLRCDRLHAVPCDRRERLLYERFVSMLARRALSMNDRIQILSKLTIRDKLMTFFSQCAHRAGGRTFSVPFDRESLSIYLGVNRAALSRELSRMQDEGIIDFYKNTFKIL